MIAAATILTLVLLMVVVYQDFYYRAISWLLLPALFVLLALLRSTQLPWQEMLTIFGINVGFTLFLLVGLSAYFSLKELRLVNIAEGYLGSGDILFLLVLAVVFPTLTFILFTIGSFLLGILFFLFNQLRPKAEPTIPLAGLMAALLVVYLPLAVFQVFPDFSTAYLSLLPQ